MKSREAKATKPKAMRVYEASLVNMHGEVVDEGTTFEVKFPAVAKREAQNRIKRNFPGFVLIGMKCTDVNSDLQASHA
jgi:hypothetical protein